MIEFFVPIRNLPTVTHQQKKVSVKNGKPVFYEPDRLKQARSFLTAHLAKHAPKDPYEKAIRVVVKWCFPRSKNTKDGEYKITKPDLDNSAKLLLDCCTDLNFWTDDNIISSLILEKFYADVTGIYIKITELEE